MLRGCTDYRNYLRELLVERIQKNPSYSLRAFALQLSVAPSMLSDVLKGKKDLSVQKAFSIAKSLGLEARETDYFCLLVQLATTDGVSQKESLLERLRELQPTATIRDLSVDVFKSIADWTHVAILALLDSPAFKALSVDETARKLGISKFEAESTLERLALLELLEAYAPGRYRKPTNETLSVRSQAPNGALRQFHRSMLQKAVEALETQSNQEKFVGSETVAFDPASLPEVAQAIEECADKIRKIAARGKSRTEVYHLGLQFFRLTQKEKDMK